MAGIPSSTFYNGKTKLQYKSFLKKLSEIEKNAEIMKNRPLPKRRKSSVFHPNPVWSCFSTQQQALDYRKHCQTKINKNVHVFAQELSSDGKRQYIVTTHKQFWDYYSKLKSSKRNFYELIPDASLCRLYFDLEFQKQMNSGINGLEVLEIFIELICYYLKEIFGVTCSRSRIIDLDSSTDVKFSRHLIFHLPNAVFINNKNCGNLMRYIYAMLQMNLENKKELNSVKQMSTKENIRPPPNNLPIDKLFVRNQNGEWTFFCDLSVYSRNRNFRILGSTKVGKNTALTVSEQNCFDSKMSLKRTSMYKEDPEYIFFIDSLVCFDEDCLDVDVRVLQFGDVTSLHRSNASYLSEGSRRLQENGYKTSPFPQLDNFISKNISKGGVQGVIRQWVHFPERNMIIYDIDRNHWCENVGRAHKSNHIYIVVDMKNGIFYQKCHDPDCQIVDFKSKEMPLPTDVNPLINDSDYMIDDYDDSFNDSLIEAAEIAECSSFFDQFDDSKEEIGDLYGQEMKQNDQRASDDGFSDEFVLSDFELNDSHANDLGLVKKSQEAGTLYLERNGVSEKHQSSDFVSCQLENISNEASVHERQHQSSANGLGLLQQSQKNGTLDLESERLSTKLKNFDGILCKMKNVSSETSSPENPDRPRTDERSMVKQSQGKRVLDNRRKNFSKELQNSKGVTCLQGFEVGDISNDTSSHEKRCESLDYDRQYRDFSPSTMQTTAKLVEPKNHQDSLLESFDSSPISLCCCTNRHEKCVAESTKEKENLEVASQSNESLSNFHQYIGEGKDVSCPNTASLCNAATEGATGTESLSQYIDDWDFNCKPKGTVECSKNELRNNISDSEMLSSASKMKPRTTSTCPFKTGPESCLSSTPYSEGNTQRLIQSDEFQINRKVKSELSILKDEFFDIVLDDDDIPILT